MSDSEDAFDKQLESFLLSEQADSIADYASRGRKFEAMDDMELQMAWVVAFLSWAQKPSHRLRNVRERDLMAEINLRGNQLPLDLVRTAFDRLLRRAINAIERMELDDPEKFKEMTDRCLHDIEAFTLERERSQN